MDTKIRLTRKPFSTALWLALVTAMTVLLCVGAGLWYSSERTADAIDGLHYTVAYRTDIHFTVTERENGITKHFVPRNTSRTDQQFLAELDCVEAVYENTLTGGYSPRFTPLGAVLNREDNNQPYDKVVFIATVTDIYTEKYPNIRYDLSKVGLGETSEVYGQRCTVKIE